MDEPGALWQPSPNYYRGRQGHRPRWIIVHGTAGFASAEAVAAFFQRPETEASTHYIIAQDGRIIQLVSEADTAWGNGKVTRGHDPWWSQSLNPNYVSISIEHHKLRRDNGDELTAAQKQSSFALIAHICERHAIPRRRADARGGITGHFSMDPMNRSYCPGPYPWQELFAYLAQEGEESGLDQEPAPTTDIAALHHQLDELRAVAAEFQRRVVNLQMELAMMQGQERAGGLLRRSSPLPDAESD
jgi:N-acetyl-anhydromuramyl-L-alanine amidase AmpD